MLHTQIKSESNLILHLAIGRITFLKYNEKNILSKKLDSPCSLVLLSIEELSHLINRNISNRVNWNGEENLKLAERAFYFCKRFDINIVLNTDEEYPESLKQIEDPPYLLFARGNLKALSSLTVAKGYGKSGAVAVVGTRSITPVGKEGAKRFAYDAAMDGCTVISGLANGADGFAHKGVIDAYYDAIEKGENPETLGKTIAVLPSAIDEIVPKSHKGLAVKILETGGCIISEYEPGMSLANWHYVGRNRIIAGLAPATVVIEAPPGSGALITAEFALENGRDLMFHQACLSDGAKAMAEDSKARLEIAFAQGRASKYKLENNINKYIDAGAPVIKNYKDYCDCLSEIPGERAQSYIQGELFQ